LSIEQSQTEPPAHLVVADGHGCMHNVANRGELGVEGALGLLHLSFLGSQPLLDLVRALHQLLCFLFLLALQRSRPPSHETRARRKREGQNEHRKSRGIRTALSLPIFLLVALSSCRILSSSNCPAAATNLWGVRDRPGI
jgi:hypothetical protein